MRRRICKSARPGNSKRSYLRPDIPSMATVLNALKAKPAVAADSGQP
jgi:hypothetical protein